MTQRFFRADEATYEYVRMSLDTAWGLPSGGQLTCYSPPAFAPRDSAGRLLLAVSEGFAEYDAVAAILPQLLDSGAVEEIDEATYRTSAVEV